MFKIKNATCTKETDRAILVEAPGLYEPIWVPLSQIHKDSEVYAEGYEGTLIVSDWFAKKRGWN